MNFHCQVSKPQQGFTLIEILVVIAIMALVMATVRFTVFSVSEAEKVERDIQRLQVIFELASDFAVLNQLEMGLRIDQEEKTYEFVVLNEKDQWQAIDNQPHFALQTLIGEPEIELTLDGFDWQQDDSLFDGRFFDEELSVSNEGVDIGNEEDKEPEPPQIFILSSGEITPFELRFSYFPEGFDNEPFYFSLSGKEIPPLERTGSLI